MRSAAIVLLAGLTTVSLGGCPPGRCAEAPAGPLNEITLAPDAVAVTSLAHEIHFGLAPPAGARRIELCFTRALDGAEVELVGSGPNHPLTRILERRVSGTSATFELPPLTFDRLEIVVHHHLRPVPLPPRVRISSEVRP